MAFRAWCLCSLFFALAGCQPASSPDLQRTPASREVERLAAEQGFASSELTVVPTREERGVERHALQYNGVPVWGIGAKTVDGATRMAAIRLDPGVAVETQARLSEAQAKAIARAALEDPEARVDASERVLLPREERRLKAGAPERFAGRRNADQFERVVTGLDLVYRLVLVGQDPERGERRWTVGVDARDGAVRWREPLEWDVGSNPQFQKVTGVGKYAGTFTFSGLYEPADQFGDASYVLADNRGNTFRATKVYGRNTTIVDFLSTDAKFGDGAFFSSSASVTSANGETAGVDAQYAVELAWTVYEQVLGRPGPGSRAFDVQVHNRSNNAFYAPDGSRGTLIFGYRNFPATGTLFPFTTTDVLGHEVGHDFFQRQVYANPNDFPKDHSELAGMNEGAGDVFGFLTELVRDAKRGGLPANLIDVVLLNQSNLTMGEETGVASRNVLSPSRPEWDETLDGAEQHSAGGPLGRMFLLLAYGCLQMTGPTPATPWQCPRIPQGFDGLGTVRAAKVFAKAVELLPTGSNYFDMRTAALAAASRLVGFRGGPPRPATGNAFAAINVGTAADDVPPEAALSCRQVGHDIECDGLITDEGSMGQGDQLPQLRLDGGAPYSILNWDFREYFIGSGLAEGSHTIELTAWDLWHNAVTRTTTVYLDKTPPTATLTVNATGTLRTFLISASDAAGVNRVEIWDGSQFRVSFSLPPYEETFNIAGWSPGTHPMIVKVVDNFDNVTVINHALVVENTPPGVTMTVGTSGPPFNVNVAVTAAFPVSRVDFKVDGVVFATRTHVATSYTAAYTPTDPLAHNLSVVVTDVNGNVGTASTAAPRDLTPPAVAFSASQAGDTVTLTTTVSDTCGLQTPYGLYVDGTLVAQPTTPSSVLTFGAAMAVGVHAFHAVVADRCGNTANFQTTFAKVVPTPPVITGIVRDDSQPKKPKFTVQCTDTEGVHHVEMRENGSIIGFDTTAPYEFVVDTTARTDGSYTVLFQCMDIYGVSSSVETRTVTADNSGPTFTFTVYGSGRNYVVSGGTVADPRGVESVVLTGGLVPGFSVTLTQAPWSYSWAIPGTVAIQTDLPFSITAKDKWGNTRGLSRYCTVNTASTTPAYLTCH